MDLVEESIISIKDSEVTKNFLDFFELVEEPPEEELDEFLSAPFALEEPPEEELDEFLSAPFALEEPPEEELDESLSAPFPQKMLARVPKVLRDDENFKECFEPKLVSIGPYHYRNSKLLASENLKKKFAKHFVSTCGSPARIMYFKLYEKMQQIRGFYDQELMGTYTDEALTQILFLDGCFLLGFISIFLNDEFYLFDLEEYSIVCVVRDTILLENQLPFVVWKLLGENNFKKLHELIERYIQLIGNYFVLVKGCWNKRNEQPKDMSHFVQLLQIGLRDTYVMNILEPYKYRSMEIFESNVYNNYSVTELKEGGIYFKPCLRRGCKCTHFSSYWFYGVLELPSIEVGLFTRENLLNLIAYEMQPDARYFHIRSYVLFLASILRKPEDVKALREALVLNNLVGSDEDVVQLFKEISAKVLPLASFWPIEFQIQIGKFLDRKGRSKIAIWLDEVFRVYFRSPWSTVTVLAGFLVLFATVIQAVLQIVSFYKNLE